MGWKKLAWKENITFKFHPNVIEKDNACNTNLKDIIKEDLNPLATSKSVSTKTKLEMQSGLSLLMIALLEFTRKSNSKCWKRLQPKMVEWKVPEKNICLDVIHYVTKKWLNPSIK